LNGKGSNDKRKRKGRVLIQAAGALGAMASSSMTRLRRARNQSRHAEKTAHDEEGDSELPSNRLGVASRVAVFGTRLMKRLYRPRKGNQYQCKINVCQESTEEDDHSHLWQMLPPGEVLHCLRLGAKALDGEDFKKLLQAAWLLFDECDAVTWMIEPKTRSDLRASQLIAVQKALAEVVTADSNAAQYAVDAEPLYQQLVRTLTIMQQLKKLCAGADDGLMRRAALYGLPILLERAGIWIHASVDQLGNKTIAGPSRVAAHEMDSVVLKVLESFRPYEVAVEDGLGYQAPHHSCETLLASEGNVSGGGAVICEEAWRRFLRYREELRHSQLNAKDEELKEHALASSSRYCTHKLLRPDF